MAANGPRSELEAIIARRGLRQVWLAERTGIHPNRINVIVGGFIPNAQEAEAIVAVLNEREPRVKARDVFPAVRAAA